MLKTTAYIFLGTVISFNFMGATTAAAAELPPQAVGAAGKAHYVARCPANNFVRLGGAELFTTSLVLRNFDAVHPVMITRLVIHNAQGVVIYDSTILGLPAFSNGILGPTNDTLNSHQTSTVFLDTFLPLQGQTTRPLQVLVESSSAPLALPLHVSAQFVVRQRDPMTGAILAERSRSGGACESTRRPPFLN